MKILQLVDTLNPGGAERMAVNLANLFDEVNLDNLLVVSRLDGLLSALVKDKSKLHFLGKRSTLDFVAFKKLKALIKGFKPNVIHAHGTSIYWGIGLKFLFPKIKLIWHDHLGVSEEVIQSNPRKELNWLASKIDYIITADETTRRYWIERKLKTPEKITYLSNFPHLEEIERRQPHFFTFLHLANYRHEKGHLHLIEAVEKLSKEDLKFKVRMVGVEIEPAWKLKVENQIKEKELYSWIDLEGPTDNTSKVLSEVNAGLVVSDREGLPVALLEYGLASLAVISTRVGQCPMVLGEGSFGKLVNKGDVRSLCDEMRGFIQHPMKARDYGLKFNKHVEENFGFRQFFEGYKQVLIDLNCKISSND